MTMHLKLHWGVDSAPMWINVSFSRWSVLLCKIDDQERKKEVSDREEDGEGVLMAGPKLNHVRCGNKFLFLQFGYMSPHHKSAGVLSKCKNRIDEQMKFSRVRQKQ